MRPLALVYVALPIVAAGVAAGSYWGYRNAAAEAERAWREIASRRSPPGPGFDPATLDHEPEIARRYFAHAIAPGTPLSTVVELDMRGTFLLGDRRSHQTYSMTARQILRPPFEFLWIPRLRSGAITIAGSDALVDGRAWTRFWLAGLVPVASEGTSSDMVRSAAFRAATEGLWLPASLLPGNGARWEQTGPDQARVTIASVERAIVLDLTLASDGAVREIVGQRWSNANPDKQFRLQPFGGTMSGEATFGGFTIPSRLKVGNHFGTDDYLPFFQAEIVGARYG